MAFLSNRKVRKNYDLFSTCAWYIPGLPGLFSVLGFFLVGVLLASIIVMPITIFAHDFPLSYMMMIMYPLQFIPVLIFVRIKSSRNSFFERGYALDSNHFGKKGGLVAALAAVGITIASSLVLDGVNHFLPDMSDSMMQRLEAMLKGPLWVSLLCTSVMAPLFEEWLCRGVILRGLLYNKGNDSKSMNPALAIVISALFFAAIHGNIWQGIIAFAMGCVFGYVYYKTGSLKLTMLMHCTNNTLAVLMSHYGGDKLANAKSFVEIIPAGQYALILVVCAIVFAAGILLFRSISLNDKRGNCDVILDLDEMAAKEHESE